MPEAKHHEMRIVPLKDSKYANRVECLGCNWQTHLLPEESPEGAVKLHQQRYGYKPKTAETKLHVADKQEPQKPVQPPSEIKTQAPGPNSLVPTPSNIKQTSENTQKVVTATPKLPVK